MYPISISDWDRYTTQILDPTLNVAVMTIAQRLFPGGYDVGDDAPDTFEKVKALFQSGSRYVIYSGGCDSTIFGDPNVNYDFRAWHDWCHWQGGHDFSLRGEYETFKMQCGHLVAIYGDNETTRAWRRILFADIIGQKVYERRFGQFPDNQMQFVRDYLNKGPMFAFERRTREYR